MESKQEIMPLPWEANIGDRLSDDGDCWVIDSEQGSVAEMQCPADVEEATARFIVKAVNSHQPLERLAVAVWQLWNDSTDLDPTRKRLLELANEALASLAQKES